MIELSDAGLKFIEGWEGYEKKLPDGRCRSYRDKINGKLDIWTCGYGCTEGVTGDTVWTQEEADAAFRRELRKHIDAVARMVTVEINQNEADALISMSYNIGSGGLSKSTVIRKLNAGDRQGAATAMLAWNKFGGKPVKGLTARRHAEAALFLTPVEGEPDDQMPQTVTQPPAVSTGATVTAATVGTTSIAALASAPPDISAISSWQSAVETLMNAATFFASKPMAIAGVLVCIGGLYLWHKAQET